MGTSVTVKAVELDDVEAQKEGGRIAAEHNARIKAVALPSEMIESRWMETREGRQTLIAEVGGVPVGVARIGSKPYSDAYYDRFGSDMPKVGGFAYFYVADGCDDADAVLKALVVAAVEWQQNRDGKRDLCVSMTNLAGNPYALQLLGRLGAVELGRGEEWFRIKDEVEGKMDCPLSDDSGPDEWFRTPITVRKVDRTADWHERKLAQLALTAILLGDGNRTINQAYVCGLSETVGDRLNDGGGLYFATYQGFEEEWGYIGGLAVCDVFGSIAGLSQSWGSECTTAAVLAHLLRAAGYPELRLDTSGTALDSTILRVVGGLGYSSVWSDDCDVSFKRHWMPPTADPEADDAVQVSDTDEAPWVNDWDSMPTGIEELDALTGGMVRGGVYLLGARDRKDATQLARRIAESAKQRGRRVHYAAFRGADTRQCFEEFQAKVAAMCKTGLDLLVIDQLQSIEQSGDEPISRCNLTKQVAEKVRWELANELRIPVLLLAEVRTTEAPGTVPSNASWSDSPKIVEHANVAMIVHRPKQAETQLVLTKNRHGELAKIDFDLSEEGAAVAM